MRFTDLLKVSQESKLGKPFKLEHNFRLFERLPIHIDLYLSVQASYSHYCNPRATLQDLTEYTTMELALIDGNNNFVSVTEMFPEFKRLDEIESHYDGSVYGFVPVDLLSDLYKELIKKHLKKLTYIQN